MSRYWVTFTANLHIPVEAESIDAATGRAAMQAQWIEDHFDEANGQDPNAPTISIHSDDVVRVDLE